MEELFGKIKTKHAPAEKATEEKIVFQQKLVDGLSMVKPFIDDTNHMFLVLNRHRQIIYANKLFHEYSQKDKTLSQRLGEALDCIHAEDEIGGCGTSENCRECGAVNAVLDSQKFGKAESECRITLKNSNVLDLDIWAKEIKIDNSEFTIVSITDISNRKRRIVLEKLFFHDILNTAGNLRSFLELMQDGSTEENEDFSKITLEIANTLIDEIKTQRMLSLAEVSKLEVDISEFKAAEVCEEILITYQNNFISENKTIELLNNKHNHVSIKSDRTLLRRVLGNLVKNALEASKDGESVSLSIDEVDSKIIFNVHNTAFIPRNIELQIFQRSFSTKGLGRGIGTYSVKLLTTKYLGGEVSFETDEVKGTTFTIKIPKELVC
ncbi:MAG: HAMP domain-containing histidine kinase [Melioribacteraceae bacterium]|nr:HAMP domain-containing histidine kinase [Melioribacteraceae bacterium]